MDIGKIKPHEVKEATEIFNSLYKQHPGLYGSLNYIKVSQFLFSIAEDLNPSAFCVVYRVNGKPVGALSAILQVYPFTNDLHALELGFHIYEGYRSYTAAKKLLKSYETWAVENKADYTALSNLGDEKTHKFYEYLGYSIVSQSYLKGTEK